MRADRHKAQNRETSEVFQSAPTSVDPAAFNRRMSRIIERAQPLIAQAMALDKFEQWRNMPLDPFNLREAGFAYWRYMMNNPQQVMELTQSYWQDMANLWQVSTRKFVEGDDDTPACIAPEHGDKRFHDPLWHDNAVFDVIKQSYLLTCSWVEKFVHAGEDTLDAHTTHKLDFHSKQFLEAIAPSNFAASNPAILRETAETGGENLLEGFENLLADIERGEGELRLAKTDYAAFELGVNLATTPGKVIYQNDLMQLIQYTPTTKTVYQTPLVIVPPWINKYYILDLREKNSLIKWLVDQGHTVFCISWVNPDKRLAQKRFADYMHEGVIAAIDVAREQTGEDHCNVTGYCIGGTLLATTLAYLQVRDGKTPVNSATFLTTLIDFSEPGDLGVFIDDGQLEALDSVMDYKGYLPARYIRDTFSMLRARDLIWSFVINNYLMGREPFAFDMLYWNDDSTNLPAAMHSYYLRAMYRDNKLITPGAIEIDDVPIDINNIQVPAYFLSAHQDHIAPWQATYCGARQIGSEATFTLAASGHIAGVVNPPAKNKYGYWHDGGAHDAPDDWLNNALYCHGSWWPHWRDWLKAYACQSVAARWPDKGHYTPVEDAPGSYVRQHGDL